MVVLGMLLFAAAAQEPSEPSTGQSAATPAARGNDVCTAMPGSDAETLYSVAAGCASESPARAVEILRKAAGLGHAASKRMLGLAYAQGHGDVAVDVAKAIEWFRAAAAAGDDEAAYNLVALCDARPSCVAGGEATLEEVVGWLRTAGSHGLAEAAFQAGTIEMQHGRMHDALDRFLEAAALQHPAGMYNAAHMLAKRIEVGSTHGLGLALRWFGRALRAARAQQQPKVEADALMALWVQSLWIQRVASEAADADDPASIERLFRAAREADDDHEGSAHEDSEESTRVELWRVAVLEWSNFTRAFGQTPSSQNRAALSPLRRAMEPLAALCEPASQLGEFRRHLVLAKLVEGAKMLAQDEEGMRDALKWHHTLIETPLCVGLHARSEDDTACFNDQLSFAVTLHRRLNDTVGADELVMRGRAHPSAATHWLNQFQTPRVFHPQLAAHPWWDTSHFRVAAALEAAWASGAIGRDMLRLGIPTGGTAALDAESAESDDDDDIFERIVLTGSPIKSAHGVDLRGSGALSEYMLFDGTSWNEERCTKAAAICAVLRAYPEVSGSVAGTDGAVIQQQGECTIFRLLPGARILPHVGVTNRRLVLQFPLSGIEGVRFRVGNESWRAYTHGEAMVFDDSHEHEVIHDGGVERFVLYAVLHHPGLGTPTFEGGCTDC